MSERPTRPESDYDRHGGFRSSSRPGPGFARFLTAMRRAQDLAVSANPDSDTWDDAADRAEELVKLLDPFEAAEGVGPAGHGAAGGGQPADAAVVGDEVRTRGCRARRAVQPVSRRRQLGRTRRCAAAVVRLGVRHGDPRRRTTDQPNRLHVDYRTA